MKDTLIKLIAPVVAIIAILGKEFGFEIGPEETNTIVAALAIVVTAIQNGINLRKPQP